MVTRPSAAPKRSAMALRTSFVSASVAVATAATVRNRCSTIAPPISSATTTRLMPCSR